MDNHVQIAIDTCVKGCDATIIMIKNFKRILRTGTHQEKMNVLASMGVLNQFIVENWSMMTQKKVNEISSA
jgi:hypothetical protein